MAPIVWLSIGIYTTCPYLSGFGSVLVDSSCPLSDNHRVRVGTHWAIVDIAVR